MNLCFFPCVLPACPSHFLQFHLANNILWKNQIAKDLIKKIYPVFCYFFSFFGPKNSPQQTSCKTIPTDILSFFVYALFLFLFDVVFL
jgi:hypothetical protein